MFLRLLYAIILQLFHSLCHFIEQIFFNCFDLGYYNFGIKFFIFFSCTGPTALVPTPTVWYIHYYHKNFKLSVNPATKTVYDISFLPRNQHKANHGTEPVEIAGIEFKVLRDVNYVITGAVLERPYTYTTG